MIRRPSRPWWSPATALTRSVSAPDLLAINRACRSALVYALGNIRILTCNRMHSNMKLIVQSTHFTTAIKPRKANIHSPQESLNFGEGDLCGRGREKDARVSHVRNKVKKNVQQKKWTSSDAEYSLGGRALGKSRSNLAALSLSSTTSVYLKKHRWWA